MVVNVAAEINKLHAEIEGIRAQCNSVAGGLLAKAIAIGEMLTDQKNALKHGEWLPWLKANVGFDRTTAHRYMKVFSNREKCCSVQHLNQVYRLLAEPKRKEETEQEEETDQEESTGNVTSCDVLTDKMRMEEKENMAAAKDAIAAIKRIVPGTKGSYEATQKITECLQQQHKRKPKTSRPK